MPDSAPPTVSSPGPGRRASITREDLFAAALALIGPNRSIATLTLREIARQAQIAPNSFYRHFRDTDELAVALIERAGSSLGRVFDDARNRASPGRSMVRSSIEAFFAQLRSDDKLMHLILREGMAGSDAYKRAVYRQFALIEETLRADLVRLAEDSGKPLHQPALAARAIIRLMFALGANAMDLPRTCDSELTEEALTIVKMIINGARAMHVDAH